MGGGGGVIFWNDGPKDILTFGLYFQKVILIT